MLLSLIVLAACGGDDTPAAAPTLDPASQTTSVPQVDAAPTDAPAEAAAPTEAPPTAAPTELPPAPTATAAAVVALGDCDNAYFPAVEGRTLTYRSTIPGMGESTIRHTFSDVTDSGFTLTMGLDESEGIVQQWTCSADGLLAPQLTQLPGLAEGMTFEYVEASGATVPAADQMTAGHEWTTHYVVEVTLPDLGQGAMTMSETIDLVNTVAGEEPVTVPAGTFDAVRVDTAGTVSVSIGGAPANAVDMSITSWYVRDTGLVRQEVGGLLGEADAIVTELVSVE